MPTHVALLRGVNVGGVKVAMADLRAVVSSLGHTDVATYIQSGNVLFSTEETDSVRLAAGLERAIAEALDVRTRVLVVSRDELARVIGDNPYTSETDARRVHVVFLPENPSPDAVAAVADTQRRVAERGSRDEATVVGRALFLHTPDGFGRSELAALLLNRARSSPAAAGTARNWSTVTKLLALCDGGAQAPTSPGR